MVNDLAYEGIKFPVSKKDYCKIELKNNICINVFYYENELTYPVYVSNEKLENCIDLLLITNENKSNYGYIKDFNRFMCNKTKYKAKKHFCKCCIQCFTSERALIEHKETCLKINGKQTIKLKSGSIGFKIHFKQIAVLFKIYAGFDCNVKGVTLKNSNHIFLAVLHTKLFVLMIDLAKKLFFTEEKKAVYRFIEAIL